MNCLYRAYIGTCTAIRTDIRINFVDITFRYRFDRALINTCSASCTIIIDYVSHLYTFLVIIKT